MTYPDMTILGRCCPSWRTHRVWSQQRWRTVWFSDESRFLLKRGDGRARVYRRRNERFANNPTNDVTGYDDPEQVLSLLVVLTVGGHVLSLAVGTYPKGERCYSGKHSAPWIHVSGMHEFENFARFLHETLT
jgi:hypothetical protein